MYDKVSLNILRVALNKPEIDSNDYIIVLTKSMKRIVLVMFNI